MLCLLLFHFLCLKTIGAIQDIGGRSSTALWVYNQIHLLKIKDNHDNRVGYSKAFFNMSCRFMSWKANEKKSNDYICDCRKTQKVSVFYSITYRFPEQFQLIICVIRRHSRDICFGHVHLHKIKIILIIIYNYKKKQKQMMHLLKLIFYIQT